MARCSGPLEGEGTVPDLRTESFDFAQDRPFALSHSEQSDESKAPAQDKLHGVVESGKCMASFGCKLQMRPKAHLTLGEALSPVCVCA